MRLRPGTRLALSVGLGLAACDGGKPAPSPEDPPVACPRTPTGDLPAGDANGDGAVDLADAVTLLRHVADGGPPPPCTAAIDLVADERLDLDDAFSLLVYLFEGGFSLPEDVSCDATTPLPAPTCSPVEARFGADGTVELRADTEPIEAWSLTVRADGCTIAAATTAGTEGASIVDDPPGQRDLGYDATFLAEGGAVSAVVLGFMDGLTLPPGEWSPVLALTLEGDACGCTLSVGGEPLAALGEPVESVVVAGGAAWLVEAEAELDLCR